MGAFSELMDACDVLGQIAGELGIGLLQAEDESLDGRTVQVNGRARLNFSSCSALGLELDPRLIQGAVEAAQRFGTQFSASRAFLSAPPYAALEEQLGQLWDGCVLVTPNTTLASASALPSLIEESDAVLLDHQVHMTVQLAVPLLQRMGIPVEFVRHGRLDRLEERIRDLKDRHRRVWAVMDGVYSMHGDVAPFDGLALLLGRYEQLHLYVDDAHGTSWTGRNGRGTALERLPDRERVVVALSLNKSFGAGGGALVLPDADTLRRVRHTAGPMSFTGPLQPPMLGAALASARIHASPEIDLLQRELRERIEHTNRRAAELALPLVNAEGVVPIRFIGLGPRPASTAMASHLMERGLLPSCALFPAVPAHQTGIRFTVTRHHRLADIDRLLEEAADFLPEALARGGVSRADVDRAFRLAPAAGASDPPSTASKGAGLVCETLTSIDEVLRAGWDWDSWLAGRGPFDAGTLRALEQAFGPDQKPENRWRFHYLRVCDEAGSTLLASFFTEACMKDDMFLAADVSREVEERRRRDPFFLTSRVLSMGAPLAEGEPLYLDRQGDWRGALRLLAARIAELADSGDARNVVLRDLTPEPERDQLLLELGFTRLSAPDSLSLEIDWQSRDEYLARLSKRARRFQRREVEPLADAYHGTVYASGDPPPDPPLRAKLHALYRNVWQRSFQVNTFELPEDFLIRMLAHPGFELVTLTLRGDSGFASDGARRDGPHAFFAARIGAEEYAPILVGLDYDFVHEHGAYRQCLAWMLRRAEQLGRLRLRLGMGADVEKRRFGAVPVKRNVWVQSRDGFHADVLALLAGNVAARSPGG